MKNYKLQNMGKSSKNKNKFKSIIFSIVLFSVGFSLSCAKKGEGNEKTTELKTTIPTEISDLESAAEDAYEEALKNNISDVKVKSSLMNTIWQSYRSKAANDGASAPNLNAVDLAINNFVVLMESSSDSNEVARAANAVSATMDELFALYDSPVPSNVLVLDYLGREVALDARQNDFVAAKSHIDTYAATFAIIRSEILAAKGSKEVADFEANVVYMLANVTAQDNLNLEINANLGLEIVDNIETVFANSVEVAD